MVKSLNSEDKRNIYNILAEAYIDLIGKGLIGKFERRILSRKILTNVEKSQTFEEVTAFVRSLLANYPVFMNASVRIGSEVNKLHEDQVINRLQSFIQQSAVK